MAGVCPTRGSELNGMSFPSSWNAEGGEAATNRPRSGFISPPSAELPPRGLSEVLVGEPGIVGRAPGVGGDDVTGRLGLVPT